MVQPCLANHVLTSSKVLKKTLVILDEREGYHLFLIMLNLMHFKTWNTHTKVDYVDKLNMMSYTRYLKIFV